QVLLEVLVQLRLPVEQVQVRRRAGLVEVDDALRLGREVQAVQLAGDRQRIGYPLGGGLRKPLVLQQRRQRRDADAAAGGVPEKLTARQQQLVFSSRVHASPPPGRRVPRAPSSHYARLS